MILNLDCRHGLAMLPDNSIDAIVTDAPYELGFMGKSWDRSGIAFDRSVWAEALRVLKPGGHMLAFSGSRTYHRMAVAIEDGGFEIRDQIMWIYGSGFPKSLDISKALDKVLGHERQVVAQHYRAATGRDEGYGFGESFDITVASSIAAQLWEGWGTGLKPAHEPICVARKPLIGTVADNVMAWGVGGINIDDCRVSARVPGEEGRWPANLIHDGSPEVLAMFPDAAGQLGQITGVEESPASTGHVGGYRARVPSAEPRGAATIAARFFKQIEWTQDDLEAALFYYCAKASRKDRDEGLQGMQPRVTNDGRAVAADNAYQRGKTLRLNHHPTVKPTELMRYLCRLVCPPGGTLLDLFAGSGSTGKACAIEGFQFVGFELDAEIIDVANARCEYAKCL